MSEVQSWSSTAASNNSASPDGWPESMAPSGINNSARENMAAIARWFKDSNGSLTSGGSSNAYTLSPNRTISAYAAGVDFMFTANHANTGAATLNVSSLGAKDIRDRNGSALVGAEISSGAMVYVSYDASNGYFRATDLGAASAGTTPDASETVKGLVELATAAETLTGTSQTLALTPYGFANAGKSLSADGYYKFPGGLIVQWGMAVATASATTTVTLPVTFPTAALKFVVSIYESNTTARDALKIHSATASSVLIANPNAATLYGYYIGIGY